MSLQILAAMEADPRTRAVPSARHLSDLTGLAVTMEPLGGLPAFRFSVAGGHACDFLGDKSIYDGAEWTFDPAHLDALAQAVTTLARECRRFTFVARWDDAPQPRAVQRVEAETLAALVRGNRVGNNVVYVVG